LQTKTKEAIVLSEVAESKSHARVAQSRHSLENIEPEAYTLVEISNSPSTRKKYP
jgi:hypothetical protein